MSDRKRVGIHAYEHLIDTIRAPDEMVIPGEQRLKLKKGGRAWRRREREKKEARDKIIERAHNRAKTQARYYRRHKEEIDAKRRLRAKSPEYVYGKAKRRALANDIRWEFTLESWAHVWEDTIPVVNPANGFLVPAWGLRGSNHNTDAQMVRLDKDGAWSPENCVIVYKGEVISRAKRDSSWSKEDADDRPVSWPPDSELD